MWPRIAWMRVRDFAPTRLASGIQYANKGYTALQLTWPLRAGVAVVHPACFALPLWSPPAHKAPIMDPSAKRVTHITWTLCPSGLRRWTQAILVQAMGVQIAQVS